MFFNLDIVRLTAPGWVRVSRRFHILAGDSELWKRKYYSRWILPRARRVRELTQVGASSEPLRYSSKVVKWLDYGRPWRELRDIDWMREYRLQYNWSKGSCRVKGLEVAKPPTPPVLVSLHNGVVFTADARNGLRAWSTKDTETVLSGISLSNGSLPRTPTAIAVSSKSVASNREFDVVIGFEDGSFAIYTLTCDTKQFTQRAVQQNSDGEVIALASCSGHLLVLSKSKMLTLYRLKLDYSLQMIDSLQATSIRTPLTLSMRTVATDVIGSVAYSFPRIDGGWSIGLQELRWNQHGEKLRSHLATPLDHPTLASSASVKGAKRRFENPSSQREQVSSSSSFYTQPPTSLSYSHPYLLAAHADNTLTMYLVVSTAERLTISTPCRLWGHTSSVSGVQVGGRGKAVSVSSRGDDIRVWELEDMLSSPLRAKFSQPPRERSVQLSPERVKKLQASIQLGDTSHAKLEPGTSLWLARKDASSELAKIEGLVGFDDERVVVLREQELETQLVECYDFT